MDFKIEYTDKELSSWGGMEFMKRLMVKTCILDFLEKMDSLPTQGSNRGYSPVQLICSFWVSIWCGGNKYSHLEILRHDNVLKKLFGWKEMAGYKAYLRYFDKFNLATNQRVFQQLYEWFFNQLKFDNYTLDFDSTIMTRYGEQQGAKKGYNPTKKGRNSHHPLLAFVADCRMVANLWMRPGNTSSSSNFEGFFLDTLAKLKGKKVGLIRMDSGFYNKGILDLLESKSLNYIIAVRFYLPIQRAVCDHKTWLNISKGLDIAEFDYQAEGWESARRIVVVRQLKADRPKATGKQLSLFEDNVELGKYRYSAYVTNLTLPSKVVWDSYKGRADSENRIKELKEDFGMDSFATTNFYALEATLNFIMIAYNLMSLFKQVIVQTKVQPQLKTLRYKLFATASYITKNGNQRVLNLAIAIKNRKWWDGLFGKYDDIVFPYQFQT
jgi:Transposase DDE domain group 1